MIDRDERGIDRARHRRRGREALLRILDQRRFEQLDELRRAPRLVLREHIEPRRRRLDLHPHHHHRIVVLERHATDDHLEQHRRERVEVRAPIDRPAERLLRRHVRGRSEHHAHVGELAAAEQHLGIADELDEAKVDDLRALPAAHLDEHDVIGLEIAMDDAVAVRVRDSIEQLARDRERAPHADRALLHLPGQRVALDQLHHEEQEALLDEHVDRMDQVLVIEHADRVRLAREALDRLRGGIHPRGGRLERELAAIGSDDAPHAAHPALAELPEQLVLAELHAGSEVRRDGGRHGP